MEKYAKLMKGLEVCAGPDCCKDGCPYYGKTTGAMTCRARLLADAAIAINNERALRESAEEGLRNAVEELDKLHADVDDLEAAANTLRAERNGLLAERDAYANECKALTLENKTLHERCQVQQNEINALVLKLGKQDDKTDRPSALHDDLVKQIGELVAHANYQQGRADTLAKIVERCSFGGGARHE